MYILVDRFAEWADFDLPVAVRYNLLPMILIQCKTVLTYVFVGTNYCVALVAARHLPKYAEEYADGILLREPYSRRESHGKSVPAHTTDGGSKCILCLQQNPISCESSDRQRECNVFTPTHALQSISLTL